MLLFIQLVSPRKIRKETVTVYFTALKDKYGDQYAEDAIEAICLRAGYKGYTRLGLPAARVDIARNKLCAEFYTLATSPDDVLVMLDYDHRHPLDAIEKLVAHNRPVVGALYFRRGPPHDPMVFFRDQYGVMTQPRTWEPRLYRCAAIGTGAIAIQKRVLEQLYQKYGRKVFQYRYTDTVDPSEDLYFSGLCEQEGIEMWCDMSFVTPHLTVAVVDEHSWHEWLVEHPNGGGTVNLTERPVEL